MTRRLHFLCIESFRVEFRCLHLFQFFSVRDHNVSFPDSPAYNTSERCGVDLQWFQDNSSQALPNSREFVSVNDFWFPRRLQELHWVLLGLLGFFVLHGWYCNHWVAKSCTTTAYRWLFRDPLSSLRKLWSAEIKWPEISALGMTALARLLQEDLVIFVFKQISQFGSFGKCV